MNTPEEETSSKEKKKIILALSGGGFRATLFHLGVVRFLFEHQLLQRIKLVGSVSGGSILAGHLAANWSEYSAAQQNEMVFLEQLKQGNNVSSRKNKKAIISHQNSQSANEPSVRQASVEPVQSVEPPAFLRLSRKLADFTKLNLRNRILYKAALGLTQIPRLFRRDWNRIALLQSAYDKRLFHNRPLNGVKPDGKVPFPNFHFLTTSLNFGRPYSLSTEGMWELPARDSSEKELPARESTDQGPAVRPKHARIAKLTASPQSVVLTTLPTKISFAVTASSAFPVFFPPIIASHRSLGFNFKAAWPDNQLFGDGGVFDNLGLRLMRTLESADPRNSILIVSNAGSSLDVADGTGFDGLLGVQRNLRASEIMMNRLAYIDIYEAQELFKDNLLHLTMKQPDGNTDLPVHAIHRNLQGLVANIRTDLDSFSPDEIAALVLHGYYVAKQIIGNSEIECQRSANLISVENWAHLCARHEDLSDHFSKGKRGRTAFLEKVEAERTRNEGKLPIDGGWKPDLSESHQTKIWFSRNFLATASRVLLLAVLLFGLISLVNYTLITWWSDSRNRSLEMELTASLLKAPISTEIDLSLGDGAFSGLPKAIQDRKKVISDIARSFKFIAGAPKDFHFGFIANKSAFITTKDSAKDWENAAEIVEFTDKLDHFNFPKRADVVKQGYKSGACFCAMELKNPSAGFVGLQKTGSVAYGTHVLVLWPATVAAAVSSPSNPTTGNPTLHKVIVNIAHGVITGSGGTVSTSKSDARLEVRLGKSSNVPTGSVILDLLGERIIGITDETNATAVQDLKAERFDYIRQDLDLK